MRRFLSGLLWLALPVVLCPPHDLEAAQLKKLRLACGALAYANPPFWIAHELKLFEKYGYDTELVYVSGIAADTDDAGRFGGCVSSRRGRGVASLEAKHPADFVELRSLRRLEEGFFRNFSAR